MTSDGPVLVCFAVKEESRHFRGLAPALPSCEILVTGIGRRNAESSLRRALTTLSPRLVVSSGFAGGLNPQLNAGAVVFDALPESWLLPALRGAGAVSARFHCAERIVSTSAEKLELWRTTGADAVDMESAAIRGICETRSIANATVRIISDTAHEDLALDFNRVMTPEAGLNYFKLACALAKSPAILPKLWRFRGRIDEIGAKLAHVLSDVLKAPMPPG